MSVARHHAEWLSLVEVSGPFLSMPVLLGIFPDGLDRFADERDRRSRLHVGNEEWLDSQTGTAGDPSIHRAWVRHVLREVLEYEDALLMEGQSVPPSLSVTLAEHGERLAPDYVLCDPAGRPSAGKPRVLINVVPKSQGLDAALQGHRWKASPATRMMTLLHGTQGSVRIGLVTNGEHWMLVHAKPGDTTSFVSFYASLWLEEPLTLQALHSLVGARRLFAVGDAETLEALFAKSSENQQEVTDQLGSQVRRAVEVLIQTIDRIDRDRGRTLLRGIDEQQLYESAVTVMMRLVFLFAAEERKLLLLGDSLYDQHYAVSTLREQLQSVADAHGDEVLQRRYDAWSRLLATFRAVHGGVQHESMRLPAYGGSLFNPDRFPFLEGREAGTKYNETFAQPLPIDSLTVLDLLDSLQLLQVKMPGGGPAETRRLSFRALGVEQIGHVYEGLLDHTAKRANGPVVSLRGSKNLEPEIELEELERRRAQGQPEQFVSYLAEETGRTASAIKHGLEYKLDDLTARHFLTACDNDSTLYARVSRWAGLIREDSHGNPVIFPAGSVYVTEGTTRRSTGTHYTPRSLTEPIVQHALEPLAYEGPAAGLPREAWKLKTAKELLALRVCDLAVGSGAFLVQACRYLSERVVEAWESAEKEAGGQLLITPEGELSKSDPQERTLAANIEERLAIARRYVADRCLYGVDINPMAVEMAKLSLWLVTLQKDRPFTFVDHALKCGDSLLGVTKIEQVENFTLLDGPADGLFASKGLRRVIEIAAKNRYQLEALPSDHYDQLEQKRSLHCQAEAAIETVRAVADLLIALELRAEARASYSAARGREGERIRQHLDSRDTKTLSALARKELLLRKTFHWAVEFPEVFEKGGFHAVIGNPPFMGGLRVSEQLGDDYNEYLMGHYKLASKKADICACFFLRAFRLCAPTGCVGLLATNSISQGVTRRSSLDVLIEGGASIYFALKSFSWPGQAAVIAALVVFRKGSWVGQCNSNGQICDRIGVLLDPERNSLGQPRRLAANADLCYQGATMWGDEFFISAEFASTLLRSGQRYSEVVKPALGGRELNNSPELKPDRWAINFGERDESAAKSYSDAFAYVERELKAKRSILDSGKYSRIVVQWWKYFHSRMELFSGIQSRRLTKVLARSRVSDLHMVGFVDTDAIFTDALVIFLFDTDFAFGVLQGTFHDLWSRTYASTLKNDVRYVVSDCFETFPFPPPSPEVSAMGRAYYECRREILLSRQQGLTKTYNRFNDPEVKSDDIMQLRLLRVALDKALLTAYGWGHIHLDHDFYETKKGSRFTLSEPIGHLVLDHLLSLNQERHEVEIRSGLHDKAKPKNPRSLVTQSTSTAQLGFVLEAPAPVSAVVRQSTSAAPLTGVLAINDHAAALLSILNTAYAPLGKSALIDMAKIPESAWSAAIQTLKSQGLVEQHGEKRSTTYARKRS